MSPSLVHRYNNRNLLRTMVTTRKSPGRNKSKVKDTVAPEEFAQDTSKSHSKKLSPAAKEHKEETPSKVEDDSSSQHTGTPQTVPSSSSSSSTSYSGDGEGDNKPNICTTETLTVQTKMDQTTTTATSIASVSTPANRGYSRLFSPYRSLGVVSNGPFYLLPNQNSSNAVVCAAIGERFHMVQCDKLQPVLVSHPMPGLSCANVSSDGGGGPQRIFHLVSDNSLSISVVAHGRHRATRVSLFQRTQPTTTLENICPDPPHWWIVDLLHLGKIKMTMTGEKQDKKENAALIAVVLSKGKDYNESEQVGVPTMGSDLDDESDQNSGNDDDDDDDDDDNTSADEMERNLDGQCRGQIVLLVASRNSLLVHKRITLNRFSSFCPSVAIHPPTYVNKIVVGGSCTNTNSDALILLNVRTGKLVHVFKCLEKDTLKFKSEITCLEPSPAIDTIAVGTAKGAVHLINIRYDRLLFSLRHQSKHSKKGPRITSMSFRNDGSALNYGIAPLAVGRSDGTITIWDLSPPGSDDDEDFVGGSNVTGRTLLCEMERVHYPGGVHKLQYMPQEPLLVSTGSRSNSLLMHIFDNPDHSGRILRQRRGHTAPPKCIRYLHGANGGILANMADGTDAQACHILSTGGTDRTLRRFSTVRSVLDKEFSQGKGLEKTARRLGMEDKTDLLLPPVSALATSEMRSRDWGDLITIHRNHPFAYVWSSKNGAQSGPILRQDDWNVSSMKRQPPRKTHATSVGISTCGNYALVGTQGGIIYKYNIQSGMTRGTYPPKEQDASETNNRTDAGDIRRTFKSLEKSMKLSNRASNTEKAELDRIETARREERQRSKIRLASHTGHAVTGIAVDSVNRTVISVGGDAKLIAWNFLSHLPHKKSPSVLPAPATMLRHVKDSDLAAIAMDDYSTLLFDCTTFSIVRRFGAGNSAARHSGPLTDLGFSPDGRTLFTSSLDGTIRVWDVPTNACVDWLGFSTSPTSLTISPTGEYLATTHTGKLGISLWSDRSFFQTVHVDGTSTPASPARMDDPAPIAEVESDDGGHNDVNAPENIVGQIEKALSEENEPTGPAKAKEQGLVTLSGLPPAHWKNLFHLELVKQRNKPKEPPKKPPSAPFFLQWRPGVSENGEATLDPSTLEQSTGDRNDDEWDAVWSDENDEDGMDNHTIAGLPPLDDTSKRTSGVTDDKEVPSKKRKVIHHRSQLASLLQDCAEIASHDATRFQRVTEYVGTLGPSAIDVSLSSLCNGVHDLEDGLPLLILASQWLIEACQSLERFDAVNAYLHRFLYVHSSTLAGIEDKMETDKEMPPDSEESKLAQLRKELGRYISQLKQAQRSGSEDLHGEMQNTLCLLRHFARMV
jgi:U3 small nucleolar RNA-associated protein 21